MIPSDLASDLQPLGKMDPAEMLYWLADRVYRARNRNGAQICDASDFKAWLIELAQAVEAQEVRMEMDA